jgi:hypothetical protein
LTPLKRAGSQSRLRGFVRCEVCGRPLTGSWSKGATATTRTTIASANCRVVNVSKATLEGAFVDELPLLQRTPSYMRLIKAQSCLSGS